MRESVVGRRTWWWVVLLGPAGQLAWTIENLYLNVFVYDTITDDPNVLATLVATSASAIAATTATLLAGAWSDRTGKRHPFIAVGHVLWGLTTAALGLVDVEAAVGVLIVVPVALLLRRERIEHLAAVR